ncbi:hypothetical protein SS50377_27271 [Spironucleus salmonicida]|uniref:Uncharacterized protein n=1 Tax=Spironucleus salmonicida TaxID=348837 RepID=V6LU29_9EUKA|nr:hypothetical protein SS50377_27271 [Spironucleus salmonicida]|eukprot:EST44299.1 Hypothetical protein SS50377_15833 [Spironucleus salmonicida]
MDNRFHIQEVVEGSSEWKWGEAGSEGKGRPRGCEKVGALRQRLEGSASDFGLRAVFAVLGMGPRGFSIGYVRAQTPCFREEPQPTSRWASQRSQHTAVAYGTKEFEVNVVEE